jgi:MFS family permease
MVMTAASPAVRNYAIVTLAYWADTLADGALRMLVLFYFYQLGYNAFQVATLFLFYEIFGVITNLCGGYLAARFGLKSTLFAGLGTQLVALAMLALLPAGLLTVGYVMASQALSGIAKDLTKMSSKSAVKLIAGEEGGRLYRWVALLTGSKNALKGVGFFLGSVLLSWVGFQSAVWGIAAVVGSALVIAALFLRGGLGESNNKVKFRHLVSRNRAVNILSVARMFLFGARDVWFVVALPVFLASVLGWRYWQVGGFMALWVMGYGAVQAAAPFILRSKTDPNGATATGLAFFLALIPGGIAAALWVDFSPALVVVGGLILFGIVFALNSAVHSYLILAYTDRDKVALNVGLYYMANACGRLVGTILSGWLYQIGVGHGGSGGLVACLAASSTFLILTFGVSFILPRRMISNPLPAL